MRSNSPACSPKHARTPRAGRCVTPTQPVTSAPSPPPRSSPPWYTPKHCAGGADHIRQLVVLGDGAHWIWNLATRILPEATQIVDLYHAREHLHDLAKLLAPALGDNQPAWLHARLDDLDSGNIETLVRTAEQLPLSNPEHIAERDTTLGYFKTNAHRMRYAYFRELGMFIGSGAVEAGCKAVIGQRLKLSGMRWSIPGATSILTLRCHQASDRWEHIWTRPTQPDPAALIA